MPVFWLFGLLDWLNGIVRPTITFAAFGSYIAYRWARLELMQHVSDQSFAWYEGCGEAVGRPGNGDADPGAELLVRQPRRQVRLRLGQQAMIDVPTPGALPAFVA